MHLKYSVTGNKVEDDEFYGELMAKHVYKDPLQLGVRIVLCRSLIKMFTTFRYEEDPNTKDFTAHYPFHHEQMLVPIIDIVEDEFSHYCTDINLRLDELAQEGDTDAHRVLTSHVHMLNSAMGIIAMGNIAKLILKCRDSFCAKKNWNSHGASVGSVIYQLASILSQMQAASVNELNHNFNVLK